CVREAAGFARQSARGCPPSSPWVHSLLADIRATSVSWPVGGSRRILREYPLNNRIDLFLELRDVDRHRGTRAQQFPAARRFPHENDEFPDRVLRIHTAMVPPLRADVDVASLHGAVADDDVNRFGLASHQSDSAKLTIDRIDHVGVDARIEALPTTC